MCSFLFTITNFPNFFPIQTSDCVTAERGRALYDFSPLYTRQRWCCGPMSSLPKAAFPCTGGDVRLCRAGRSVRARLRGRLRALGCGSRSGLRPRLVLPCYCSVLWFCPCCTGGVEVAAAAPADSPQSPCSSTSVCVVAPSPVRCPELVLCTGRPLQQWDVFLRCFWQRVYLSVP